MSVVKKSLDEFLCNVLRGAAKMVGCNSTNLVVVDEELQQMRVRVGARDDDYPILAELEDVLGGSFDGLWVSLESTKSSYLYRVWLEGTILETSRVAELVGQAFSLEVVEQFEEKIGEHRYLLVPAIGASRNYGVLIFEKAGCQPFSNQQREVVLHYARRIGEILECEFNGQGLAMIDQSEDEERPSGAFRLMQQERLAAMGEMTAQLAHEIRNPLLAIGATLESLCREAMNERQQLLLSSASREISRLDMILKKYLSANNDMVLEQVNLYQLLQDVRRLLAGAQSLGSLQIEIEVDQQVKVRADYESLKHVFFNVLSNALEASPVGGEVRCRLEETERDVSIYIEDQGPGLSASAAQCIEPFFTTKQNGTGLGLPVCQKIVLAHGGLLELVNRQDQGCRVLVVLPKGGRL
jgi:signal transduction histidine kinase